MIKEVKRVTFLNSPGREMWFFTTVCLIGQKAEIPTGKSIPIYRPRNEPDFVSKDLSVGEVTTLPTCTMIAPGGEVLIHNSVIDDPVLTVGGLRPVGNGIHPVGAVDFEGVIDSMMYCVGPRENMKGFEGKELTWVNVYSGESYTFGDDIIGFVVVYGGPDEFKGFTAEPGDTYTAPADVVLAVVTKEHS